MGCYGSTVWLRDAAFRERKNGLTCGDVRPLGFEPRTCEVCKGCSDVYIVVQKARWLLGFLFRVFISVHRRKRFMARRLAPRWAEPTHPVEAFMSNPSEVLQPIMTETKAHALTHKDQPSDKYGPSDGGRRLVTGWPVSSSPICQPTYGTTSAG